MLVDTNVLVRHLVGDPPDQARRATAFLAEAEHLELPSLIVAELVYVLESVYATPRPTIATAVRSILGHPPIDVLGEPVLLRTIELYDIKLHVNLG